MTSKSKATEPSETPEPATEAPEAPASSTVEVPALKRQRIMRKKSDKASYDPNERVIAGDGDPRAPRLSAAWQAVQAVLADGEAHRLRELVDATDLKYNSVQALVSTAVKAGKVERFEVTERVVVEATGRERDRRTVKFKAPVQAPVE